jgi:D-serine deaminase-like pyridoxal phosphate-dependent protein
MEEWYEIDAADLPDSPSLVIYRDHVRKNVELLINMIDSVDRLRPHVKTCKSIDAVMMMLAAGIKKFKCATIAEAEMLAMASVRDILIAYQPVGPKFLRLIELIKKFPNSKFSCMVDNRDTAAVMSAAAMANDVKVNVYLDLNVGMNRTGIVPGREAFDLYMYCFHQQGVEPVGLHVYDGHIHEASLEERTRRCDAAFESVFMLQQMLVHEGRQPVIVAGGSPTFPIHARRSGVECSPGTFIYWDKGYQDKLTEQPFLPAALVLTRVISLPSPGKICVDLGHKSVAAENDISKRVYFLNAPDLRPVSQSEEHLVLEAGDDHSFKVGDVLYGLPFHICPTVALHECAVIVSAHDVIGMWKTTSRDRRLSI